MYRLKNLFGRGRKECALCAVICLVLTSTSCSYLHRASSKTRKTPAPPVEAKGPIVSMLMAESMDGKGHAVKPDFTFSADTPQVTAIVHLGKINGSQLNVTWYETTENGDKKLFEHQIPVKSHECAFSIARKSGTALAAGIYKVIASIDGQSTEVNWEVPQPKVAPSQQISNLLDGSNDLAKTNTFQSVTFIQNETAQGEQGNDNISPGDSPAAGASGTLPPIGSSSGLCIGGGDDEGCGREIIDSTSDTVSIYVFNPAKIALTINAVNSSFGPTLVGTTAQEETEFLVDPCAVAGEIASDLPGTKVTFQSGNSNGSQMQSTTVTLGDDRSAPTLKVTSTPERGTKVKPGDKIKIKVTATEQSNGGSWQTGVKVIQVTAQPGGLVKDPWVNSSRLPKPCLEKTWEQDDEATYTVPSNPPPIIKICALAEDYVGNQATPVCGNFATGNLWKGTMRSVVQANFENYACSSEFQATLGLVVTGDDLVGDGRATYSSTSCREGPVPRCDAMKFTLKGHAFSDRLEINFVDFKRIPPQCVNWGFAAGYLGSSHTGQTMVIPIAAPGVAYGQTYSNWTSGRNQYSTSDTTRLKCESCAH